MRNLGTRTATVVPSGAPARVTDARPRFASGFGAAASNRWPVTTHSPLSEAPVALPPVVVGTQRHPARQRRHAPATETVVVVHRGREFVVKRIMADLFLKQARRVVTAHGSELVPLAHRGGVDLLFITRTTPWGVHGLS